MECPECLEFNMQTYEEWQTCFIIYIFHILWLRKTPVTSRTFLSWHHINNSSEYNSGDLPVTFKNKIEIFVSWRVCKIDKLIGGDSTWKSFTSILQWIIQSNLWCFFICAKVHASYLVSWHYQSLWSLNCLRYDVDILRCDVANQLHGNNQAYFYSLFVSA